MSEVHPAPIDELIEPLLEALKSHRCAVVEATTGAGKTTRLPQALLQARSGLHGEIWVAEPRRVAARLAARYVAASLGFSLGEEVGYTVRFENQSSAKTVLRYVTEGILLQRLSQRSVPPPAVIVLDEFHERHLDTDVNLMLARRAVRQSDRVQLIVMSATLDAGPIAQYLDGCPTLRCEGRAHPLSIVYEPKADDRPVSAQVASAVKQWTRRNDSGNLLAFLPGVGEIHKARASLETVLQAENIELHSLYGQMPLEQQARAIAAGEHRKVVLATNVAESSVTVQGVTAVVDCGLARVTESSSRTATPALVVREISQASARQRAGRAGRTAPGWVHRLYTRANFEARPAQQAPEVQRLELSDVVLQMRACDLSLEASEWLASPPAAALQAAVELLNRLGLLEGEQLTALGRRAHRLPTTARLARLVLEGQLLQLEHEACLAAALLSEQDIVRQSSGNRLGGGGRTGFDDYDCDLDRRMDLFRQAEAARFSSRSLNNLQLHPARVDTVRKLYRQLLRASSRDRPPSRATVSPEGAELGWCLLAAFPDKVARRRRPGGRELSLCTGHGAQLAEDSAVRNAPWLLALATDPRGRVTVASPLPPEWLLERCEPQIECVDEYTWDAEKERAWSVSSLRFGALPVEESRLPASPCPPVAALVQRAALAQRANLFGKKALLEVDLARAALLAQQFPELGLPEDCQAGVEALIAQACQSAADLAQVRQTDWKALFDQQLTEPQRRALRREAPPSVQLRGGRKVTIEYEPDKAPWIASRLQDFFGMTTGPTICSGRLPLTLHLLAPNRRAVQITSDLAGFWQRHYPSIRKELRRRYPRHPWPEDPLAPAPTP